MHYDADFSFKNADIGGSENADKLKNVKALWVIHKGTPHKGEGGLHSHQTTPQLSRVSQNAPYKAMAPQV